jgi:hypothetical protein
MTLLKYGDYIELFKLHDQEDFLEKFDELFARIYQTQKDAKKARALVEDHYSVKTMVTQYLKEYEK